MKNHSVYSNLGNGFQIICIGFCLFILLTVNASITHADERCAFIGVDGVCSLYHPVKGAALYLETNDLNKTHGFVIEGKVSATPASEGAFHYWNMQSYPLNYASGGSGVTSRLHLRPGSSEQHYTWLTNMAT